MLSYFFICRYDFFFVPLHYQIKTIEEMTNFMKHYEAGSDIRTKLTTRSAVQVRSILDKVFQIVEDDNKMEKGIEYYKEATLNIKYGSERCNEKHLTIGFILEEATMSWGAYDILNLTCLELELNLNQSMVILKLYDSTNGETL